MFLQTNLVTNLIVSPPVPQFRCFSALQIRGFSLPSSTGQLPTFPIRRSFASAVFVSFYIHSLLYSCVLVYIYVCVLRWCIYTRMWCFYIYKIYKVTQLCKPTAVRVPEIHGSMPFWLLRIKSTKLTVEHTGQCSFRRSLYGKVSIVGENHHNSSTKVYESLTLPDELVVTNFVTLCWIGWNTRD